VAEDQSVPATLARIDERTKRTEEDVKTLVTNQAIFATKRELEALEKRFDFAVATGVLRFEKIEDKWYKTIWGVVAGGASMVAAYIFGKL
jgi:hypothetical protein